MASANLGTYYHYMGSLTTPKCEQTVTWNVMSPMYAIPVTEAQVRTFLAQFFKPQVCTFLTQFFKAQVRTFLTQFFKAQLRTFLTQFFKLQVRTFLTQFFKAQVLIHF